MVKFILGVKGSGKTKRMIDMANESVKASNGNVVYIDRDRNHIYDLNRNIRLIEAGEFQLENLKSFYGFICGVISQNFDIDRVFIDGQKIVSSAEDDCLEKFVKNLENLNEKFGVNFTVSCSRSADGIPEFLKSYLI
ncbi:MAG TPA: twitching motility protein PilT [Clostridia bacterium]|nr:twitching motility protein PilT [Clostridia bacterium]